jgi:lysophospholipase L1-like esterase
LFALLVASALEARAAEWVATWGAAPEPPMAAGGRFPATPSFANQTVREVVRLSAGGQRVRIRFTNAYGTKVLRIGAARVALADASGAVREATSHAVLFAGKPSASIPAGAPLLSDPIDLPVKPLASLSISIYLPEDTGQCTCHSVGMQTAYVSGSGDFTDKAFTPARTMAARAFISGVEVETSARARAVVVLGDSISDGVGSTANANRRWPDLFAQRLAQRGHGAWGVVNMGISGNRVLADGAGQSALTRFDRDVLSVPGAAYVIVFEGVNDLGISYGHPTGPFAEAFKRLAAAGDKATAATLIAGYRQIIARAHAKGLKVFAATITPYGGAAYYSEEGEAQRDAINRWIRTSGAFDAVLDFDAVLRDPSQPTQMPAALHAGDHLHGSDAGYAALAKSIDLSLFK